MKWNKLEDQKKWPEGLLLTRTQRFTGDEFQYIAGHIEYNVKKKKWYFINKMDSDVFISIDSLIKNFNADFILLANFSEPAHD